MMTTTGLDMHEAALTADRNEWRRRAEAAADAIRGLFDALDTALGPEWRDETLGQVGRPGVASDPVNAAWDACAAVIAGASK